MDTLNAARTQTFNYDSLDRITSFFQAGNLSEAYTYDSFGNMSRLVSNVAVTGFDPATNRISNLPCANSLIPFDAAGNQLCDTDANGAIRQYGVDAESHITQIAILGSSPFETYIYDADGSRVRKTNNGTGTWTEYVYFNGQPLAEKNSDGTWSDYIFANGKRIAQADGFDIRIHMSGTNCSGCGSTNTFAGTQSLTGANGTMIQNGDLLTWRQYQDGVAAGGTSVAFNNNRVGTSGVLYAADGQLADADTRTGNWYQRVADLSAYHGMSISNLNLYNYQGGAPGNWDIYLGDISLVHPDGSVVPIYNRSLGSLSQFAGAAESNVSVITEKAPNGSPSVATAMVSTTYYSFDQIGSTQILTDPAGWPVSSDTYYPFGQEANPPSDNNHYKFTGKERDTESGLDYFGARYYASSMGRWMSPDWSAKVEPIPYGHLDNPQSLNLYGYVLNNPLSKPDLDGHGCPPDCGDPTAPTGVAPPQASLWDRFVDANVSLLHLAAVKYADWTNPTKNCPVCQIGIMPFGMTGGLTAARAGMLGVTQFSYVGESGFVGRLASGAQISAGFESTSTSLGVNISHLAAGESGGVNFRGLEAGATALAKSEGASSLTIKAVNVIDDKLAGVLTKSGYTAQSVTDSLGKTTTNYTKTICINGCK